MGFGKDGKGQILWDFAQILPGALVAGDTASAASANNLEEDFRMLRMDYFVSWFPVLTDGLEGPLLFGVAAGQVSAGEVEECIEARPKTSGDVPASEEVMRPVWPLETFQFYVDAGSGYAAGGDDLSKKGSFSPKWTFLDSQEWNFWVYNYSSNTLVTGGQINVIAKCFGVWVV